MEEAVKEIRGYVEKLKRYMDGPQGLKENLLKCL